MEKTEGDGGGEMAGKQIKAGKLVEQLKLTKADEIQELENELVLLQNGGSCNACTLKQCIIFRCITQ